MRALRLTDPDGYTVDIRDVTPDTEAETTRDLLDTVATADARVWGHSPTGYTVTPDPQA
ncbi:hypothetical protein [Streptomyces chilikensis]|uniref:Uncharacterized protein n=1 Tax=Streptomyces chilikensis TaxID=1194079 RepID=A0ABV3ERB5_9ACTN